MKMTKKAITLGLGLVVMGSASFAQSLADARKAVDAEQYQKATAMLKTLVKSGGKGAAENYFSLGDVYLRRDYVDSARAVFTQGVAADPKNSLNYIGLGEADLFSNNPTSANTNFAKAVEVSSKKDYIPQLYIGKAYIATDKPDFTAALPYLQKADELDKDDKDAEIFVALGDYYALQKKNSDALVNYMRALSMNTNLLRAKVQIGRMYTESRAFPEAEDQLKEVIAADANYGPAYREIAELYMQWANQVAAEQATKSALALTNYKKYLDLTDLSAESEMRYADFLIQAGDYTALEQVANDLAKSSKSNLRIYRYLGYAGYENKNYQAGLDALQKFVKEADAKRIIPRDYLYLGRLQLKTNQDSLGILNLNKAIALDSTFDEAYNDIATSLYTKKKYVEAGDAYKKYIEHSHHVKLTEYFREGMSYYYGYSNQYYNSADNKGSAKPDSTLLASADSAFSYIQQKTIAKPVGDVLLYRARIKDLEEKDRSNIQGLAKPLYEQYITLETVTPPTDERTKKNLSEAYAYLGSYYDFKEKDDEKAMENFKKANEIYPDNKQAKAYLAKKGATDNKSK